MAARDWPKIVEKLNQPATTIIDLAKPTPTPSSRKTPKVIGEIRGIIKGLSGTYGVYVYGLKTGEEFGINQDEIFPAASLIKLPVFVAVYQEVEKGNLSLGTKYKIQNADKVAGAGSIYYAPAGTTYTYQKMLELMGQQSDNTAFNIFVKMLGKEKIQAVIDSLGMEKTSFEKNETTPAEIGMFFRKMYGGGEGCEGCEGCGGRILELLTGTIWEDRIPAGVPEGIRVSHKVGTEIGVLADAGIVFAPKPYILVIMSKNVLEKEAKQALPEISRVIWGKWGS
jgi:beta-lactamase class A